MGKYHSELLMFFNLSFLMKCEYIGNEHVFCSRRVYFSTDLNSTYKIKHFFTHQSKGKPKKKIPWISKVMQNLQLHYICHAFSIKQAAMFVYESTGDYLFDFWTGFFFTSLEMFLYIKIVNVENNSENFSFTNIFIS